jgi:chaperonin GroES
MQVRPLYDRILVKRVEEEARSKGGLFLPETAKEKPSEGMILAIGQGRVSENGEIKPLQVKVGDRIAFGRYAGNEIKVNGEDRLILREDEVFGVID